VKIKRLPSPPGQLWLQRRRPAPISTQSSSAATRRIVRRVARWSIARTRWGGCCASLEKAGRTNQSRRCPIWRRQSRRCRPTAQRKRERMIRGIDFSYDVQIATLSANIPLEGHFSAHGMPHRPCVIPPACGSTRQECPLATSIPFVVPLVGGSGLVTKVRSLPSARGPGASVEVAAAPGAWRGVGKCARGNAGPVSGESTSAARQTKQRC
jgi:hypothetical protein